MSHFARIVNGIVASVITVNDADAPTEQDGREFLSSLGLDGEWVQTSELGKEINGEHRGPYAGIGYSWNGARFLAPQPFPSWVLDELLGDWVPPVPRPQGDPGHSRWDEASLSWIEVENP